MAVVLSHDHDAPPFGDDAEVIINTLEINANLKFNFHLDNPTYFQNFNLKIISNLMSGGRLGLGFRV